MTTFGPWARRNESPSNPGIYRLVLQHLAGLEGSLPDGLGALLRSMLAWDPADRPSAQDALAHQVWEQVAVTGSRLSLSASSSSASAPDSSAAAARRRRSGAMAPSGSRGMNKRMRDLDPRLPPRPLRGSAVGSTHEVGITRTSGSESLLSPPPA